MNDHDNARRARQLWAKACIAEQRAKQKIADLERQIEALEEARKKATRDIADHDRWFRGYAEDICDRVAREIPKPVLATEAEKQAYYQAR